MSIENPYEFLSREDLIAICQEERQLRTALLTTLREGVEGLNSLDDKPYGRLIYRDAVLALLEKAGGDK